MGSKVLIVEDEMLIALATEAVIQDAGFESVGIAATSDEARRLLDSEQPDVALVDLNLADGPTGIVIGEELAQIGVRVVFFTANPAMISKGVPGALGVVEKPADEDTLLQVIDWAARKANYLPGAVPPGLQLFASG